MTLSLEGCDMIQKLPDLQKSLKELKTSSWLPRAVPNLLSLTNLVDLTLSSDRGYGVDTQVWNGRVMSWIQHLKKYLELVNIYNQGEKVVHLPSSVCKCKTLSRLVIDGLNIKQLPENIGDLKHLKTMKITNCLGLKNLPDSIGGLQSLGHLCLRCNRITQLPESIGMLTNLITLDVSFNKLRGLPATICDLVHLQELDVSHNKDLRGDIAGKFDKLRSLKTLDFSKTGISSLPVEIASLSRLKTLSLEGCDEIQELPDLPESPTKLKTSSWLPRDVPKLLSLTNLVNLTLSRDRGYGVNTKVWNGRTMSWIQNLQKLEN